MSKELNLSDMNWCKKRIEELEQANSECKHHYENALRSIQEQIDALLADNERLRKAIGTWERAESPELQEAEAGLITAMNTTPAQSLARIRNQMREECIAVLEAGRFLHDDAPAARLTREAAKAIRATKEPE